MRRITNTISSGRRLPAALAVALLVMGVARSGAVAFGDTPVRSEGFRVIVSPSNSTASVTRSFVVDAFLKKITSWPGGEPIRPVDLRRDSPVRQRFSSDLLGRSLAAVRSYWQHLIFSGRGLPPPEVESDDEVVRFVLRQPGAIGYVSEGATLRGAKVLVVR